LVVSDTSLFDQFYLVKTTRILVVLTNKNWFKLMRLTETTNLNWSFQPICFYLSVYLCVGVQHPPPPPYLLIQNLGQMENIWSKELVIFQTKLEKMKVRMYRKPN
jgi:hypothetical protein